MMKISKWKLLTFMTLTFSGTLFFYFCSRTRHWSIKVLEPVNDKIENETIYWRKVTIDEVIASFAAQSSDRCINDCNVTQFPQCACTTPDAWKKLFTENSYELNRLLNKGEYIYEFEKEYLSYPPLNDSTELPDVSLSRVVMFGAVNGSLRCKIGDKVSGRVDLVNGYGRPRNSGGDELRVWLIDKATGQYKSAGHTTDLKNGSYLITGWCLWPGNIKMNVAVAYPREYIRVVILQSHLSVSRYILGQFRNDHATESTVCFSLPNVIGRPCVCNLTHVTGQSLYCGRPLNKKLSCEDWTATQVTVSLRPRHITHVERKLVRKIPVSSILKNAIPSDIEIIAFSKGSQPDLQPCSRSNYNITWDTTLRPSGFWKPPLVWQSLLCTRPTMHRDCLRNTTVMLFGDSNAVRLYYVLRKFSGSIRETNSPWPLAANCSNPEMNTSIRFVPHELPLYQHDHWTPRLGYKSVGHYIDSIPSEGKYIVIVHYYLHAMPSHISVVHSRLKSLIKPFQNLLVRNPNVLIAFRGPHVTSYEWADNHYVGGDNLGSFYLQLIQETFRDIKNMIIFLNGWDMTIALENSEFHPSDKVPYEMVNTVLSFWCNETGYVSRAYN